MNKLMWEIADKAKDQGPNFHYYDPVFLTEYTRLVVEECMAQCEQVATDADATAKSQFVTDAGRMLHEGMWGGAKNCSASMRHHFGIDDDTN